MSWRGFLTARGISMSALAAIISLIAASAAWAETDGRSPLSEFELTRLAEGRLVMRPIREVRGDLRLLGGASFQVIGRPCEQVWRALLDTPRYAKMIPTVSRAQSLVEQPDYRLVRFEHRAWPINITYSLDMRFDADSHEVTFALDPNRAKGPRAAWGFISLRPHGDGQTLLSYGVMADPGGGFIATMLRGTVHDWMLRVPQQMKRFIESDTARVLYADGR